MLALLAASSVVLVCSTQAAAVFSYGYVRIPNPAYPGYWNQGERVGIFPQGAFPGTPYGIAGAGENNYWFVQSGDDSVHHVSAGFVSTGAGVATPCGGAPSPSRFMEWQTIYNTVGCVQGNPGIAGVEEEFSNFCQASGIPQPGQNGYWHTYFAGWGYLAGPLYIGAELHAAFVGGQTSNALATPPHLTSAASLMSWNRRFHFYQTCGAQNPYTWTDYVFNTTDLDVYAINSGWWVPTFRPSGWQVGVQAF